jgi:hypothetical protein
LRAAAKSTNASAFILPRRRGINAGRAGSVESKKSAAACNMLTERAVPRALSRERRRCSAWPLRWRMATISSVRRCFICDQPARHASHSASARSRIWSPRVGGCLLRDGARMPLNIRAAFCSRTSPRTRSTDLRWHLDEMALTIASRPFWLWRAADGEGEVLDLCSNDAGKLIGSEAP